MKEHYPHVGLARLCGLFGASRQAYYQHLSRQADTHVREGLILDMVKKIRTQIKRSGSIKVHQALSPDLRTHNIYIGRDRFHALLRDNDQLIKPRKRYYVRTTDSNHRYHKWPNLTGELKVTAPHQLWVSDITYLRTAKDGFLYLSLITDGFSRKIVGHHLSYSLSAKGPLSALNKAIAGLPDGAAPIHHSDRGVQYCCDRYVSVLQANGIAISMTQNGSPYENAMAERVNGILKSEFELDITFKDYREAVGAVSRAIDIYNRVRPHFSCGLRTPEQAHQTSPQIQPINPKPLSMQTDCQPILVHYEQL
jgi:transposase InsO family protein